MTNISRKEFLKLMGCGALGLAGAACSRIGLDGLLSKPKGPPNIVFMLIDDLGWADVSYNGSEFYDTPNIDRLAKQGMVFTDAYAAAPLCSPTRASILTGKSPAQLHLTSAITYNNKSASAQWPAEKKKTGKPWEKLIAPGGLDHLPLEEVTIAELLQDHGYTTGFFGKWHLGKQEWWPENNGFDLNFGGTHNSSPPKYFYPYKIQNITTGVEGEYITDRLTDEAETFLEDNRDNPFLLYFSHYAVHGPWQAKKDLIAKYESEVDPDAPQHNPVYAAMIDSVDQSVGRIMKKLDKLGLADNTVLIFTSDNGGLLQNKGKHITSNSPLRGGKAYIYEGGIREPMIVRWPGVVEADSECDTPVISYDFFPTMLDIARAAPSSDPRVEGTSLVPLLKQTGGLDRDAIYFHFPHYIAGHRPDPEKATYWTRPCAAVRQGDYKYIHFFEGERELYNLREDIGETKNLAEAMPAKVDRMHKMLVAWLEKVDAWQPRPNPIYDPTTHPKAPKKKSKKKAGAKPGRPRNEGRR